MMGKWLEVACNVTSLSNRSCAMVFTIDVQNRSLCWSNRKLKLRTRICDQNFGTW